MSGTDPEARVLQRDDLRVVDRARVIDRVFRAGWCVSKAIVLRDRVERVVDRDVASAQLAGHLAVERPARAPTEGLESRDRGRIAEIACGNSIELAVLRRVCCEVCAALGTNLLG